jgi:ATP-dependent DNA ligase
MTRMLPDPMLTFSRAWPRPAARLRGGAEVGRLPRRVLLRSRQGTDMTPAFPEIRTAALAQLPDDTGLDGGLAVWETARLVFERLQQRLTRRRGAGAVAAARTWPAHYVVFDLLHLHGADRAAW